jgi:glucose/arabinose dehydrogenase
MTAVKDGGFYGWPFSYYGQHVDTRVPANPEMVAEADRSRLRARQSHRLARLYIRHRYSLPAPYRGGAFIGQHGSWNRNPLSGYKVIFVPFKDGRPSGEPIDVLTGFVDNDGKALGRPVGVAIDKAGALLVADDVGNAVWRVTPAAAKAASALPSTAR